MSVTLKLRSKVLVVVDLAVEDDVDGPILVGLRLPSRVQIDDLETPDSKRNVILVKKSFFIGSPVPHQAGCELQVLPADMCAGDPADSAHYDPPTTVTEPARLE